MNKTVVYVSVKRSRKHRDTVEVFFYERLEDLISVESNDLNAKPPIGKLVSTLCESIISDAFKLYKSKVVFVELDIMEEIERKFSNDFKRIVLDCHRHKIIMVL